MQAADVIVEADLRGVETHGINALAGRYFELESGAIAATASPSEVQRFGSIIAFDGHNGYGADPHPRKSCLSLPKRPRSMASDWSPFAIPRTGGVQPTTRAGWRRRGFIAITMSNTNPAMPLWGSAAQSVGNNPLTIAAPRRHDEPLVLDISMQQISWGGISQAAADGRRLPGQWGYDSAGLANRRSW